EASERTNEQPKKALLGCTATLAPNVSYRANVSVVAYSVELTAAVEGVNALPNCTLDCSKILREHCIVDHACGACINGAVPDGTDANAPCKVHNGSSLSGGWWAAIGGGS